MADEKFEFFLSLSINAFNQAVKQAVAAVDSMGGRVAKAVTGVDAGFKRMTAAGQAYKEKMDSLKGSADSFKSTMLTIGGVLGGTAVFGGAARAAGSFNSTIEQSRIGIAALVRTFTTADMTTSFVQAEDIQKRLQVAGLQTTATYQELLKALQEGIGPALREQFNPDQIVRFTQGMTQAAAALSVPMDQLGQELRSVLDGSISSDARIAKALQITNEDIKGWKEAGTLFQELEKRMAAFAAAGEQSANTFGGAWSNVQDSIQMALGKAFEQSFKKTTEFLLRVKDAIVTVDAAAGTFKFNEKIMAAFAGVDQAISKALGSFSTEQISDMLANFVGTLGNVGEAVIKFATGLATVGEKLGGLGPMLAKVITWGALLGGSLTALIGLGSLVISPFLGLSAALVELTGVGILGGIGKLIAMFGSVAGSLEGVQLAALSTTGALGAAAGASLALMGGYSLGRKIAEWEYFSDVVGANKDALAEMPAKFAAITQATGVTVTSMKELDEAVKRGELHFDATVGAWVKGAGEMADAVSGSADKQSKAVKQATDEMKKKYKEYADEVKRLQDDIADREQSLADRLREMDRSGMSDMGAWKDRKAQAEEYAAAAKKAAEEARQAFAKGNEDLGRSKAEEAVKLYDKAGDAAADLNREVREGDQVVATQQQNLATARGMVDEYGRAVIEVQKELEAAMTQGAQALDAKSGGQLSKELPEVAKQFGEIKKQADDLAVSAAGFNKAWDGSWQRAVLGGKDAVAQLEKELKELTRDRHIKVYVEEVEQKKSGGLIGMMHGGLVQMLAAGGTVARNILAGGFLPGFGGGDRRLLYGEDGEVMLNKYAVQAGGLRAALAFNAGQWDVVIDELLKRTGMNLNSMVGYHLGGLIGSLPSPQALAGGGVVTAGNAAAAGAVYNLTVNYTGNGSRQDADNLANTVLRKIEDMNRRRSR